MTFYFITVWRETLAVGKFGEFSAKHIWRKENLANFVHAFSEQKL